MNHIIVINGPTGVGKTTVIKSVIEQLPQLKTGVTYTTREIRPKDKEDKDMRHITKQDFIDRYERFLISTGVKDSPIAREQILNHMVNEILLAKNIHPDDRSNTVIAVNEACMNIIKYANSGEYNGDIFVNVKFDSQVIIIEILDNADPVDIETLKPLNGDVLNPGGQGLHIMYMIMDSIVFSHKYAHKGNSLVMKKRLREANGI